MRRGPTRERRRRHRKGSPRPPHGLKRSLLVRYAKHDFLCASEHVCELLSMRYPSREEASCAPQEPALGGPALVAGLARAMACAFARRGSRLTQETARLAGSARE